MKYLQLQRFINLELCRKAERTCFTVEKCYCISEASKSGDKLKIYFSKGKKHKNITPSGSSIFAVEVKFPTYIITEPNSITSVFSGLSPAEKDSNFMYATIYILVREQRLVHFVNEVYENMVPGVAFQLSKYGNIMCVMLNKESQDLDEHYALESVAGEIIKEKVGNDIEFVEYVSIGSKILKCMLCTNVQEQRTRQNI